MRFLALAGVLAGAGQITAGLRRNGRLLRPGRARRAAGARAARVVRYSAPLVPSGFFTDINRNGDRFLVAAFLGKDMLGIYGSLYALGNFIGAAAEPFMNVLLPFLAKTWRRADGTDAQGGERAVLAASFALYGLVCSAALGVLMLMWGAIDRYYLSAEAAAYDDRQALALLVGAGAVCFGLMRMLSVRLFKGATNRVLWLFGSTGLVNISLNLILIPAFGLMGAAMATIGSSGFGLALALTLRLK